MSSRQDAATPIETKEATQLLRGFFRRTTIIKNYFIHHRPSRFTIGTTTCSNVESPKQSIR